MANGKIEKLAWADFFVKNSKKILLGLISFVVVSLVVTGGFWLYYGNSNKDVVAVVGKEKITKDNQEEAAYGVDFSEKGYDELLPEIKEQLDARLILDSIVRQEAKKLGLTVTDTEIRSNIKLNEDKESGWIYDNFDKNKQAIIWEGTRVNLLKNKVVDAAVSRKEGTYLNFNFHKFIADSSYAIPGNGDAKLFSEHKEYAKKLADKISEQLSKDEITIDQAKQILLNDPTIGTDALKPRTPSMSMEFTADEYMHSERIFANDVFKEATKSLGSKQTSQPIVDKANFDAVESEYRYIVIYIENSNSGTYNSYEEWLSAKTSEYVKSKLNLQVFLKSAIKTAYASPVNCLSECSGDNADLYISTFYRNANNNGYLRLGGQSITFKSGASDDPATALNDGVYGTTAAQKAAGCKSPALKQEQNATTRTTDRTVTAGTGAQYTYQVGDTSLCEVDYSYYCMTSNVAWLNLNDAGRIRSGDVGSGTWYWELQNADTGTNWANNGMMTGNRSAWPTNTAYDAVSATNQKNGSYGVYYSWSNTVDYNDYRLPLKDLDSSAAYEYQVRINLSNTWNIQNNTYNGETVKNSFVWRPNYRTLTYDANGGAGAPGASTGLVGGQSVTLSATEPTRSGYTFGGWYTSCSNTTTCTGTGYQKSSSYTMPNANTTLYAKWSLITYNITPSADTGCNISPSTVQTVDSGANSTAFSGTANTGYTFNGLSLDGAAAVSSPRTFTNVTAAHTIRAKCTANPATYTVTYNGNGNTSGTVPVDSSAYTSGTSVTVKSNSGSLQKTGYSFLSWNTACSNSTTCTGTDRSASGTATFSMGTANVTLFAKWNYVNQPPAVTPVSPVGNQTLPIGTTTVDMTAYSVDDANSQTMIFYLYKGATSIGNSGWFTPYFANNVTKTFTSTGLTAGNYTWTVQAYDGTLWSSILSDTFTIPSAPTVSCTIVPTTGTTPFTVKYTYSITNPVGGQNITINLGSADAPSVTTTRTSDTIYRTYNTPGSYNIVTTYAGGTLSGCNVGVVVKNASDGGGGEVIPR
jgi:uncharacterized repeat protein (TIGR02543 family)